MLSTNVTVNNDLGLHARAAAQVVKGLAAYRSKIVLQRDDLGLVADAKSILSLLTLSASKGTVLRVVIEGEDEIEALSAVQSLFTDGFGENTIRT